MDWLKELSEEEINFCLQGDAQIVYHTCGLDTLISLAKNLSGISIYISQKNLRDAMKCYIKKNFDGSNHKELAIKLGVTERFIYDMINEISQERRLL
jgi:Mor family transcriptional regulator